MPERAWSLARQNSGADAALAAAAAAGKRPSLRIVPSGNSAPPGQRRVWVRKRGTSHATSVLVESDELVDDLKTKVLNRFPTTLLRLCDPADLIFGLPEDVVKLRSASPNVKKDLHPNWQSPSTSTTPSTATAPTTPTPSTPGKVVELHPEEPIVPLIDRYFPQGMTVADALEVYTVEQSVPAMPSVPLPARQFKFRANPPTPNQRPSTSRVNSFESITQTPASATTPSAGQPARSTSRSRSISRGRVKERQSPKPATLTSSTVGGSGGTSSATSSSGKDSGVLLLPRQFRVPDDPQEQKEADETTEIPQESHHQHQQLALPKTVEASELEVSLTHLSPNSRSVNEKVIVPQISVLIVEDNVINQKILEAFMRRKSVCYAIAKNGKEAVSMWRQGGFHLILMDIQLPVMTGLEATKEIRRLEYVNRIGAFSHSSNARQQKSPEDELIGKFKSPVIIVALTASSASKDKSEALAAGCNDFLTKPVNLLWLEQKILEWGCMQALIDFDGWKQWIHKSLDDGATPSPAQSMTSATLPPQTTEAS